jgi:hypothetical protein
LCAVHCDSPQPSVGRDACASDFLPMYTDAAGGASRGGEMNDWLRLPAAR